MVQVKKNVFYKFSCFCDLYDMQKDDVSTPEEVAKRLIWIRDFLGLSQKEFATSIGATSAKQSNWERADNRLSMEGALRINKVYGISLDFLFLERAETLPPDFRNAWVTRNQTQSSIKK